MYSFIALDEFMHIESLFHHKYQLPIFSAKLGELSKILLLILSIIYHPDQFVRKYYHLSWHR